MHDANKKLFDHAYAWMQHCSEQAEYFDLEGEDDTAEKWRADADESERDLKRYIDTPAPSFDDVCSTMFNHPDFVVGNVLAKQHIIDNGMDPDKLDPKLSDWASEPISETMWECVAEAYPKDEDA